jgi:orotidine-5'-phosphate decarboxylase
MAQHFGDALANAVRTKRSILCVGLDPQLEYIPASIKRAAVAHHGRTWGAIGEAITNFNGRVMHVIEPYTAMVKPQLGFYLPSGEWGIRALQETLAYAEACGLLRTTDAKANDGSDTADSYAAAHIGEVPFWGDDGEDALKLSRMPSPIRSDCVTVTPYIGDDCVQRFVKPVVEFGTGIFVVDKTSFKPVSRVEEQVNGHGLKLWQTVAEMVAEWSYGTEGTSGYRSVGVVLGATRPEDAPWMRRTLPQSWMLVPGYGAQGGGADGAIVASNNDGLGCIVNSSRGILYPWWDFRNNKPVMGQDGKPLDPENFEELCANAARDARDELNAALDRAGKLGF